MESTCVDSSLLLGETDVVFEDLAARFGADAGVVAGVDAGADATVSAAENA